MGLEGRSDHTHTHALTTDSRPCLRPPQPTQSEEGKKGIKAVGALLLAGAVAAGAYLLNEQRAEEARRAGRPRQKRGPLLVWQARPAAAAAARQEVLGVRQVMGGCMRGWKRAELVCVLSRGSARFYIYFGPRFLFLFFLLRLARERLGIHSTMTSNRVTKNIPKPQTALGRKRERVAFFWTLKHNRRKILCALRHSLSPSPPRLASLLTGERQLKPTWRASPPAARPCARRCRARATHAPRAPPPLPAPLLPGSRPPPHPTLMTTQGELSSHLCRA